MKQKVNKVNSFLEKAKKVLVYVILSVILFGVAYITEFTVIGAHTIETLVGSFFVELVLVVFNVEFEKETNDKTKSVSLAESFYRLLGDVWNAFCTKPIVKISVVMFCAIVIGIGMGKLQFFGRIEAFATYGTEKPEPVGTEIEDENELNSEDKEWFKQQNPELIAQVEGINISTEDLEMTRFLSEADREEVFFLGGAYSIENWDDDEEVVSKVRAYVLEKISLKRDNIFDMLYDEGGADESTRGIIARISEEEKELEWFSQRKANMELRQDIYAQTPKGSIANLISNDEHFLALVLYRNNGNPISVLYYYSKSIEYRMQRISFDDISLDHIKSELEWTSARYADIVYTCSECQEVEYAKKLQKAFSEIAKEF